MVDFTLTPVDINKLTISTKTLVVRLRRQQELTCVPNLSSKPSVTRDTSRSNYNLHTVCNVSVISNSPLWKKVITWVESSCPRDCGKVWGNVGYCHRIQRPPKQSHNPLVSYSRPRLSLFSKVGYGVFVGN